MSEELQKIVDEYREKEIHISDEEAGQILWLCNRKMDICKIENREEYLPLLFKDEVKNYLFRCSVNATTFIKMLLSKWGMLSVDMQRAIQDDQKVYGEDGDGSYGDNQPDIVEAQDPFDKIEQKEEEQQIGGLDLEEVE